MRVGFDARWYNGSGVGTYVAELLNALANLREEVDLVVFEDPANPVPIASVPGVSRVLVRSSRFSLGSQLEMRAFCKSAQIDVFHLPYQYGAPLLLPCPLVVTVHDLIPFLFRTRSWPKELLIIPFVKLGYRAAALRASHIIADSMNTARDVETVLGISPLRITTIYLAASKNLFHRTSDDEARGEDEIEILSKNYGIRPPYVVVGSAGNWRTKNLETALRALALGREKSGVAFQTVVYGPEKGLNAVAKQGLTFELDIRPVGYLPVNDLAATFRNAELFISTSLYEGFGLPVLEAMACGCPVVASNGGSLAEVAANGAQTFEPMDADAMSEAVAGLLSQPSERKRWRERALRRAAEFSWRNAAEQTLAVYKKVYDSVRSTDAIRTGNSAIGSALPADQTHSD